MLKNLVKVIMSPCGQARKQVDILVDDLSPQQMVLLDQVWRQARDRVCDQVREQLTYQMWRCVRDLEQTKWNIWYKKVGDWR